MHLRMLRQVGATSFSRGFAKFTARDATADVPPLFRERMPATYLPFGFIPSIIPEARTFHSRMHGPMQISFPRLIHGLFFPSPPGYSVLNPHLGPRRTRQFITRRILPVVMRTR